MNQNVEDLSLLSLVVSTIRAEQFLEVGACRDRQDIEALICRENSCSNLWAWVDEERQRIEKFGARVLHPWCLEYPTAFVGMPYQPTCLIVKGDFPWLSRYCLSVVGSREPSWDILDWMDRELSGLTKLNISLVSGGARGVDQMAHQICLRESAPTVAFMPSGLSKPYPNEIQEWQSQILNCGGCFVSEFPMQQRVQKHHFQKRNRLIAALSPLTLALQAAAKSGTYITARHAREMGHDVAVVPGFPGDLRFRGSLDLLFEGAQPVRDQADILSLMPWINRKPTQTPNLS